MSEALLRLPRYLWLPLVVVFSPLRAQSDYQLFRPGVQYLYEDPAYEPGYLNTLNSQYYGARVERPGCDTLYETLEVERSGGDFSYCIRRSPSPFGYSVCQRADSVTMNFGAGGSLLLLPSAGVGERWRAGSNDTREFDAEVSGLATERFLGLTDSVKTITFYRVNTDSVVGVPIRISKTFGLLTATRFFRLAAETVPLELAGMNSPAVGVQLPADSTLDAVAVGDVIHIEETTFGRLSLSDDRNFTEYIRRQHEIVGVDTNDFGFTRLTSRENVFRFLQPEGDTLSGRDSILILDTLVTYLVDPYPEALRGQQPGAAVCDDDRRTCFTAAVQDGPCGLVSRRRSVEAIFQEPAINCAFNATEVDGGPGRWYTPHLPFILEQVNPWQRARYYHLQYLNTVVANCGTPFDFSAVRIALTDAFDPAIDSELEVFPNPAGAAGLQVELPEDGKEYTLTIIDVTGRELVRRGRVRGRGYMPTAGWPAGTYTLLVYADGRPVARRRIVITP